jgi:type III restriction enzyme
MFQLKDYQKRSLDTLRTYFRRVNDLAEKFDGEVALDPADVAFQEVTKSSMGRQLRYNPVSGLEGLLYVCVRIPTGGGKTYVATHAVGAATEDLLGRDQSVVLWLVPTTTILEQTLETLKDPDDPHRRALERESPSPIRVLSVSEALEVNRATLDARTTVIVSTMQAFRIEDTEGRKVYEDSGQLMGHFENLDPSLTDELECYENGQPKRSLANVLALRRPLVIVDEAHHARTELSFETLSRFRPSGILEFTATPHGGDDREDDRRSNVLVSVSAAELKTEEMIKLPIELTVYQPWTELLNLAIEERDHLEKVINAEESTTGESIRPVMLIKAEANRGDDPVTYETVEETLQEEFGIPEEQIAVATGDRDDLDDVDVMDRSCPIRYVITVQKLGEGWDCPWAYVLCSVAAMRSNRAVEQMVGRVLRMPEVTRKQHDALNKAYAFAADEDFADALRSVRDVLVENGFEPLEADQLVQKSERQRQSEAPLFTPPDDEDADTAAEPSVDIKVDEVPNLNDLPDSTRQKVSADPSADTVTYRGSMSDDDRDALKECLDNPDMEYKIDHAQHRIREKRGERTPAPAEQGRPFEVPRLVVRQGDAFETFRETHFTDTDWRLSDFDATLPSYEPSRPQGRRGAVDTDDEGELKIQFLDDVRQQLTLLSENQQWDVSDLVYWLDRTIPHPDIRPQDSTTFLERLVQNHLIDERGFSLDALVRDKYRLKRAVEARIDEHRTAAHEKHFERLLWGGDGAPAVTVDPEVCFELDEGYPYTALYDGEYKFVNHYHGADRVGQMNQEEAKCAFFLDRHSEIEYWVRNLDQNRRYGFWLQTASGKFYPDFVCTLADGRTLVVEYKGEHLMGGPDATEKENVGEVWAKRSNGRCLFTMVGADDYKEQIRSLLS